MEIIFLIFISAAAIQVLHYGIASLRLAWYKPYENPLAISDRPVTVVICARNELQNLKNLIPKLLKQAYVNFEIVVVDDRSDDGTYEYLRGQKNETPLLKVVRVDFVPDHVHPKKFALTLGIKAASHDIVLLTDADCEPATIHWIHSMISQFDDDTQFVLGYSSYISGKGLLNRFIRYETIQTGIAYLSAAIGRRPYMGVGRNLAYRKSFFMSVKGFYHNLKHVGGDDDLLINRYARGHNTRAMISRESLVYSWAKTRWGDYFIQKKRHLAAGKQYKLTDKIRLSLINISKILFWFSGVILLASEYRWMITAGIAGFWLLILLLAMNQLNRKTGTRYELVLAIFMDMLYTLYLLIIGTLTLVSKRIRWR